MPHGVHAFCEAYRIDGDAEQGLEVLRVVMGDKSETVTPAEYKEAGFKTMQWKHILVTYEKYKCNIKAGRV
jgi:hypothetical protein